jgi:hypothetical protein
MKYHNTEIDVALGDRVIYRHLFFGKSNGVVAYLPGVSKTNGWIEFNGGQQWVIKLENGSGVIMLYYPELEFAHARVRFIARGVNDHAIGPNERI